MKAGLRLAFDSSRSEMRNWSHDEMVGMVNLQL